MIQLRPAISKLSKPANSLLQKLSKFCVSDQLYSVGYEIQRDVTCDENYEFPDNQLLLDGEVKHLKNLRGIFKSKSKTEIMNLQFGDDILAFKGEINNKLGYEIKT